MQRTHFFATSMLPKNQLVIPSLSDYHIDLNGVEVVMCPCSEDTDFLSFVCPSCHQEIEAPFDMAGQETECPTCATTIKVPDSSQPGTIWAKSEPDDKGPSKTQLDAMKSRTIRIELPDSW
jgi:ribosomal protein S27E